MNAEPNSDNGITPNSDVNERSVSSEKFTDHPGDTSSTFSDNNSE